MLKPLRNNNNCKLEQRWAFYMYRDNNCLLKVESVLSMTRSHFWHAKVCVWLRWFDKFKNCPICVVFEIVFRWITTKELNACYHPAQGQRYCPKTLWEDDNDFWPHSKSDSVLNLIFCCCGHHGEVFLKKILILVEFHCFVFPKFQSK